MPDDLPEWALDQASTILNGLLSAHHIDLPSTRWAHAQRYVARDLIAQRRIGREEMRERAALLAAGYGDCGYECNEAIAEHIRVLPLDKEASE